MASTASLLTPAALAQLRVAQCETAPLPHLAVQRSRRLTAGSPHLVKWQQWQRRSQGRVLCEPGLWTPLEPAFLSPAGHTLEGHSSSPKGQERARGPLSRRQGRGRYLAAWLLGVSGKVCSARGGGWTHGAEGSGELGGLSVSARVKEEGPAQSLEGTSPARAERKPPPFAAPKIALAATSVANGTCHSLRSPMLTRDWNLRAAAPGQSWGECTHVPPASGLGMQSESFLGLPGPAPPFHPPGN